MSANEATGESTLNENALTDELISRMGELEEKYKEQFNQNPLHKRLTDIVSSVSSDPVVDPLKLCAIFTDFADAFLDKAFECNQTIEQNAKLNKELYKANDLIRRLTDENEYHLNKLKFLAKQLEIYKDSWKGKLTEKSVERQISDLIKEKDEQMEDLRKKLESKEQDLMRHKFDSKNSIGGNITLTPSKKFIGDDESKQFSELQNSDARNYKLPRSLNFDDLYAELNNMDHKQLVEYCIDLKQKSQQRSKSKDRSKTSSAVRNSQGCNSYKSLTNAERATENLEKKYKRFRKIANELVNKNTVYQNDIMKAEKRIEGMETRFNSLVEDFQKYINQKETELAEKDKLIQEAKEVKNEVFHDEQFHPITVDEEERNTAIKIYGEIIADFKVPQERDEVMLDTIQKYIYDKKQPNVAY